MRDIPYLPYRVPPSQGPRIDLAQGKFASRMRNIQQSHEARMRLTTRTNLATRILMACAVNPDRYLPTGEIAELCNCSTNHAAHVVQRLHAEGYLDTTRGRSGGIRLSRATDQISIGTVFRLFEADIPFAECFDIDNNNCPLVGSCRLRSYIHRALDAFYHELDRVTPDDLVRGNCGLSELLAMHPTSPEGCRSMAPGL